MSYNKQLFEELTKKISKKHNLSKNQAEELLKKIDIFIQIKKKPIYALSIEEDKELIKFLIKYESTPVEELLKLKKLKYVNENDKE